jgi:hypothetical protein
MLGILHRAVAALELELPALPARAFGPGAAYDFLKSLKDVLKIAVSDLFIIDPYIDGDIFDTYISDLDSRVSARILTDKFPPSLKPAVAAFRSQHSIQLDVRASKAIHDRVVFVDRSACWVLGQSVKDAARRKPTYLAPLSPDIVAPKLADYEAIWSAATPI